MIRTKFLSDPALVLIAAFCLCLWPGSPVNFSTAHAQTATTKATTNTASSLPNVVIKTQGSKRTSLYKSLKKSLSGIATVIEVPSKRQPSISTNTPTDQAAAQIIELCEESACDVWIHAKSRRQKGHYRVEVDVYDGVTGEELRSFGFKTRKIPLQPTTREKVRLRLQTTLDNRSASIQEKAQEQAEAKRKNEYSRNISGAIVLGPTLWQRKLRFTSAASLVNKPPEYSSDAILGGGFDISLFPWANKDPFGFGAGLGVNLAYDRSFGATTPVTFQQAGNLTQQQITTSHNYFSLGLQYVVRTQPRQTSGTDFTLSVAYERLSFTLAEDELPAGVVFEVPDVSYQNFSAGMGVGITRGDLSLGASVHAFLPTKTGQIQQDDQYGGGTVTGIKVGAHVQYVLGGTIPLRLQASYRRVGYDFRGNGDLTRNRDGDVTTIDVGGAEDRYLGVALLTGFQF